MLLAIEARIGELSVAMDSAKPTMIPGFQGSKPTTERYQGVPTGQRAAFAVPKKHDRLGIKLGQMATAQAIAGYRSRKRTKRLYAVLRSGMSAIFGRCQPGPGPSAGARF